jgi:hypothetical protein
VSGVLTKHSQPYFNQAKTCNKHQNNHKNNKRVIVIDSNAFPNPLNINNIDKNGYDDSQQTTQNTIQQLTGQW